MADDHEHEITQPRLALSELEEGISLARRGDLANARGIFKRIISRDPNHEDAWLWLAWSAENAEQSLRYLQEAKALLPDNERIAEGVRWAEQRLKPVQNVEATQPQASRPTKVSQASHPSRRTKPPLSRVSELAQVAQSNAAQRLGEIKEQVEAVSSPGPDAQRFRAIWVPAISLLSIIGMLFFIMVGINNARERGGRVVQALVLPTIMPDATPTLTYEDQARPLWIKVDVAWTRSNWGEAIAALEQIRQLDPNNQDVRERLAEAHYQRGVQLIAANQLDAAQVELDQAIRLHADLAELQEIMRELKLYRAGLDAYQLKDWPHAVENLSLVYELNPNFRDTQTMLGQSLYQRGIERQDAEVWDEALSLFQEAQALLPDLADAGVRAQACQDKLTPPKRIEVDISDKLCTLYEEGKVLHTFPVCTGRASAPTLPGRYQVLDKIPNAYASKWDLQMPWWLGIYWAGGSENGFHALPILSNGQILWSGSLGTGCSFGCIVLDTKDAKFLYDWAEIGDVVLVTY